MNWSPKIKHNVPLDNTMNHEFRLPKSVIIILKLLMRNLLLFILSKKQKQRTKHLKQKQMLKGI